MGSEQSTPKSITQEQLINMINLGSAKTVEHSERSANALTTLAYVALALLVAAALYTVYRLISKYERLQNQAQIARTISLNKVTAV